MCFSANASFGAGIILSVVGVASIKKAKHPSQIIFASIPLIFCVQQIAEGFLWLALSRPGQEPLRQFTTYIFLFFAQVAWPLFVPLSILLLESKKDRKSIHKILTGTGILVSLFMAFCLSSYHVEAKIIGHHISYELDYPASLNYYGGGLYIIATIAPAFFSSIKRMWYLGIAILISYIMTRIFYIDYIVSVWCFFASVISITVLAIMYEMNKPHQKLSSPTAMDLRPV